jgi:hypothetical protein
LEFAERTAVDGDDVGEPERQVGQIIRKDLLSFAAVCLPFFAVHFGANLVDERVKARVAVVSAIGAVGRERLRGKKIYRRGHRGDGEFAERTGRYSGGA